MRIYSCTLLSWPEILHVSQIARFQLSSGRWHNYYFYKVAARAPTNIITYSPISLLQENREYYCYERLLRNKLADSWGNVNEIVTVNNRSHPFPTEVWSIIPYHIAANDVIVVKGQVYSEPGTSLASTSLELS